MNIFFLNRVFECAFNRWFESQDFTLGTEYFFFLLLHFLTPEFLCTAPVSGLSIFFPNCVFLFVCGRGTRQQELVAGSSELRTNKSYERVGVSFVFDVRAVRVRLFVSFLVGHRLGRELHILSCSRGVGSVATQRNTQSLIQAGWARVLTE